MLFNLENCSLLGSFWILSASLILVFHGTLKHHEKHVPDFIRAAYLYGKQKNSKKLETRTILPIPKSWFTHFYALGVLVHSIVFITLCGHLKGDVTFYIRNEYLLQHLYFPAKSLGDDNGLPVLLVFGAEWFQMVRRLYECLFISSWSKGTMSPLHYFYGLFLYSTFGIGLLSSVDVLNLKFSFVKLHWFTLPLAAFLFMFGSYFQHRAFITFAALRKPQKDKTTNGHYIPDGHLFNWVSCPHYLCEIIIYLSFVVVFHFNNSYINFIFAFVSTNQVSSAIMTHEWYVNTFQDYPKSRTAIFPQIIRFKKSQRKRKGYNSFT